MNQSFLGWRKMGTKVRMFCDSDLASTIIRSIEWTGSTEVGSPDTEGFRTVWYNPSLPEDYVASNVADWISYYSVSMDWK